MMNKKIFVTGSTGNVGSEVVKYLTQLNKHIIAGKLSVESTENTENITYVDFNFNDPDTWKECLKNVDKVFLMRPPHISNIKRDMLPFMKYLKEINIKHVVFLSVQGVEGNKMVPHYKIEQYCIELELPYTFVRPSFFMQNLTTTHLGEIRDEKQLFIPAGKGKTNFIDVADIGEICAKVLTENNHINIAYTVTGEKSYSYDEIASILSEMLQIKISYKNPNPILFVFYHLKRKRKLAMTLVMLALYTIVKLNKGNITTSTTEKILMRKPRTLSDFILNNKNLFLTK